MTTYCTDVDLITWEPNVLKDAAFASQTLIAGTADLGDLGRLIDRVPAEVQRLPRLRVLQLAEQDTTVVLELDPVFGLVVLAIASRPEEPAAESR